MNKILKNKIAALELDEIGKLILGLALLVVLLVVVFGAITGELSNQVERIKNIFNFF